MTPCATCRVPLRVSAPTVIPVCDHWNRSKTNVLSPQDGWTRIQGQTKISSATAADKNHLRVPSSLLVPFRDKNDHENKKISTTNCRCGLFFVRLTEGHCTYRHALQRFRCSQEDSSLSVLQLSLSQSLCDLHILVVMFVRQIPVSQSDRDHD